MDRFTDLMVRDVQTGDCFRADHLIEGKKIIYRLSLIDYLVIFGRKLPKTFLLILKGY